MNTQTVTIEAPESTIAALQAKAEERGISLNELLRLISENITRNPLLTDSLEPIDQIESLLDTDYIAKCTIEADSSITHEEVRKALSSISGSMSEEVSRERDER
jgi:hypothetical protein